MDEVSEKILSYLSSVDKASNKEIAEELRINPGLISRKIKELQDKGLIQIVHHEGRTKYYALKTNLPSETNSNKVIIDANEIESLSHLRAVITKELKRHNWSVNPAYSLAITNLLIAKHTNARYILFGPQGSGKSSCIKAVFPDAEKNPRIVFDLHRKQLKEIVNLKETIQIIEEQYRHNWGMEDPKNFDKFLIVPMGRIAPSEFLFRFIPLRIKQPKFYVWNYKPVVFEIKNLKLKELPESALYHLNEAMSKFNYFTNDASMCKLYIEALKQERIASLYKLGEEIQLQAKQWKIEQEFNKILGNDFLTVNFEQIRNKENLWLRGNEDLQLMNNATEILKFAYALSKDEATAVMDTFEIIMDTFETWTDVYGKYRYPKIRKSESQTWYRDSAGVVHNVVM